MKVSTSHLRIAQALAVIAGILPVLQSALPAIAPWGTAAAAGIGVLGTLGHLIYQQITRKDASSSTTADAGVDARTVPISSVVSPMTKVLPMLLAGLMVLVSFTALPACTTMSSAWNSGSIQSATIQAAVTIGVTEAIAHQPGGAQQATAATLVAAMDALEGVVQDGALPVLQFDQALMQAIAKTKLQPASQAIIVTVAQLAAAQLAAKINQIALASGAQVPLLQVISWIRSGAVPYAGLTAGPVIYEAPAARWVAMR